MAPRNHGNNPVEPSEKGDTMQKTSDAQQRWWTLGGRNGAAGMAALGYVK